MRPYIYFIGAFVVAIFAIGFYTDNLYITSFVTTSARTISSVLKAFSDNPEQDNSHVNTLSKVEIPSIINGNFNEGVTGWSFHTNSIGTFIAASTTSGGLAGKVIISRDGSDEELYQQGIALKPSTHYRLSFSAKSSAGHDVSVSLINQDGKDVNDILPKTVFDIATATKTYSVDFITPNFGKGNKYGRLTFWLAPYAEIGDEYWFDDIALIDLDTHGLNDAASGTAGKIATTSSHTLLPVIIPQGGTFPDPIMVAIRYGSQAKIYYTLDGSVPTKDSTRYSEPFILATSSTISAIVIENDLPISLISTSTFVIGNSAGHPLLNGSFDEGIDNWEFYTNGYGAFAVNQSSHSGHSGYILISDSSNVTELFQKGIQLEPKTSYKLSFMARSNRGHGASVSVVQDKDPSISYGLTSAPLALTTEWKNYSFTFTTSGFDHPVTDGRFQFSLTPYAAYGDEYWFDDVSLEKI
jgi:hypothetical protein